MDRPAPNVWGSRNKRRIGLLGGSFNPAHDGHKHISDLALKTLQLDEVWWLVSPQNPLKSPKDMMPLADRLASARAVSRHPRVRCGALESAFGTRYTADTLRVLKQRFPHVDFVWLMGADNLEQIPRWQRWTEIFRAVPIAIFVRKPYSYRALAGQAAHRFRRTRLSNGKPSALAGRTPPAWSYILVPSHPASATAIRAGLS